MARLYVFGIGGTGARVIKSLAMLLASGVRVNATDIVPILIDPDISNGDLSRTAEILRDYGRIRGLLEFSHNGFFRSRITALREVKEDRILDEQEVAAQFLFDLYGIEDQKFKDFIGYATLDDGNKDLVNLLYSEENLNADLKVGFKGNPNLGSVVLNQFLDSKEFRRFASNFEKNDRIFIISSIFGGTGAAGFPLLLKNIRNADDTIQNHAFLRDACIGAVTVLPYFGVEVDAKSKIDKATFVSKAKAALSYYALNITGNKSVNAMYYLGDSITRDYPNHEGSSEQENDAHLIELLGALSIVDFMSMSDAELVTRNGRAVDPKFREFGIKAVNDDTPVNFLHFERTRDLVARAMSQYMYFVIYLRQQFNDSLERQPWSTRGGVKIDRGFAARPFLSAHLRRFNDRFYEWIREMGNNSRGFAPFNLGVGKKSIFRLISSVADKRRFVAKLDNYALFDDALNAAEREIGDLPSEQKFMAMFYKATDSIINYKFNI